MWFEAEKLNLSDKREGAEKTVGSKAGEVEVDQVRGSVEGP